MEEQKRIGRPKRTDNPQDFSTRIAGADKEWLYGYAEQRTGGHIGKATEDAIDALRDKEGDS